LYQNGERAFIAQEEKKRVFCRLQSAELLKQIVSCRRISESNGQKKREKKTKKKSNLGRNGKTLDGGLRNKRKRENKKL